MSVHVNSPVGVFIQTNLGFLGCYHTNNNIQIQSKNNTAIYHTDTYLRI